MLKNNNTNKRLLGALVNNFIFNFILGQSTQIGIKTNIVIFKTGERKFVISYVCKTETTHHVMMPVQRLLNKNV